MPKKPKTAPLDIERNFFQRGFKACLGVDEAGRGAFAGGLAVAAVQLPLDSFEAIQNFEGVRDSKDYRNLKSEAAHEQRVRLSQVIRQHAAQWAVGWVEAHEINEAMAKSGLNLAQQIALNRAFEQLDMEAFVHGGNGIVMADQNVGIYRIPSEYNEPVFENGAWMPSHVKEGGEVAPIDLYRITTYEKGDRRSLSIAAASILAKVYRDEVMIQAGRDYPGYQFESNKGYGTHAHTKALKFSGVTPIHRTHYAPVARVIEAHRKTTEINTDRGENE